MECKAIFDTIKMPNIMHWNITRMECKDTILLVAISVICDWNITRMECKGINLMWIWKAFGRIGI